MSRTWLLFLFVFALLPACAPSTGLVSSPAAATDIPPTPSLTSPSTAIPETPSLTPPSTAMPPSVDLSKVDVQYSDRPDWQALLGWPDECEETFQGTSLHKPEGYGGVSFYKVADEQYLAFVTCTLGPYWVEERLYLLDDRTNPPTARHLTVPELTRQGSQDWVLHEIDQIHGLPLFNQDTQTLINLVPFRGLKDCGFFYKYRFEHERFVLEEARYHAECGGANPVLSDQWEIVYTRSTATVSPTIAPADAALKTGGPYLMYKKNIDQHEVIIIMDADGSGRKTLPLPAGAIVSDLAQAVSPNGKWLAFHMGSAEERTADRFSLTLNLMDVATGQTQPITSLLSSDYPENFRRAADEFARQGIVIVEGADPSIVASFLQEAFISGIHALAWSPAGRYLAFAGQMDGPSSDLYVYDTETRAMMRLSDGPEQIQSITWSPDGKWILHGSALTRGEGTPINYHAAAPDGSSVKTLSSSILDIHGWIGPATYLQSRATNGPAGLFDLRSVDIETGEVKPLWGGTFRSFAIDPENQRLAIDGFESVGASGAPALYLVNLADGDRRRIADRVSRVEFLGAGDQRFIYDTIEGDSRHTRFLMADGSTRDTGFSASRVSVSPDRRYLLVIGEEFKVYTVDDVLVRTIDLPRSAQSVEEVIWRPDSAGFFFTIGSELYAANLLAREAYRVDEGLAGDREFDYVWIGSQ